MEEPQERGLFTGAHDWINNILEDGEPWDGRSPFDNQGRQESFKEPPGYQQSNQNNSNFNKIQNNQYPICPASQFGDGLVRYGAKIGIKHNYTGRFLSSRANINYKDGSGQQQVFLSQWNCGENEYWQVLPPTKQQKAPGTPVDFNSTIRLIHLATGRHLHSHNINTMSGGQEVSGFGDFNNGDDNDDWIIEPCYQSGQNWQSGVQVKFKHCNTGKFLKGHEKPLINSQVGDATQVEATHNEGEDGKWNIEYF